MKIIEPPEGKVYVVGDVHGYYNKLMDALDEIDFNREKDILISVGDLIDRGPDSWKCLNLINEPWFYSCLGNHEDLMFRGLLDGSHPHYRCWIENGGDWWLHSDGDLGEADITFLKKIRSKFHYQIQIGDVGFCHAQPPLVWAPPKDKDEVYELLWGRSYIEYYRLKEEGTEIEGISQVYVGHTPVDEITTVANITYMDTGVCFDPLEKQFDIREVKV